MILGCNSIWYLLDANSKQILRLLSYVLLYFRRKKKATFDTASKISEPRLGEQYRAIADYTKEDKWDLNLKAGAEVEVIEKTESGRYLL